MAVVLSSCANTNCPNRKTTNDTDYGQRLILNYSVQRVNCEFGPIVIDDNEMFHLKLRSLEEFQEDDTLERRHREVFSVTFDVYPGLFLKRGTVGILLTQFAKLGTTNSSVIARHGRG